MNGRLIWLVMPLVMGGCARPMMPAVGPLPDLPGTPTAAPRRISGNVGSPDASLPPQIAYGTVGGSSPDNTTSRNELGDTSLDFADTDIREVVAQILGNILKVNYTIDPAVRGTVTLRTVQPITRNQLLPTLQSLLAQNGAALVQSGSLYRVVPAAQAATAAGGLGLAGTVVVPLRYASAEDLAKVLLPYVGEGGKIVPDPGRNALLLSSEPQARDSLISLIKTFDVDILARQSYALLPVAAGDVKDFAGALQDAFRGQSGGALAGLVRVVPMARISAVLIISQQSRYIEEARRVYGLVERTRRQTVRNWRVHYLQNGQADDIAYVLQQAFTPGNVTAQPASLTGAAGNQGVGGSIRSGGTGGSIGRTTGVGSGGRLGGSGLGGGGLGTAGGSIGSGNLSGGGLGGGSNSVLGVGQGQSPNLASATPPTTPSNPLLGPLDSAGTEANVDTLRIIPDRQNNALLFYGTQRETDTIEAMLRKIDILPLQVRIDAVIAEVTLNDRLQYGTQFFFRSGGINGILSFAQTQFNPAQPVFNAALPGFSVGGPDNTGAPFALSALQNVTTVNVLSSPQLLVLDNQPARLQVGDVVPYLSQTSQSTLNNNAPIISSINYQQTGVIMEVTPRVNSGGLVTLDVMQDVSDVSNTITTQGINSPTFQARNVTSRVVVQDGQTIGLAGLIRDNLSGGNAGIPWLKDIPILGIFAGQQNNSRQRTELLILITPHVVHDQRDARALTDDMREQLINAAAVPDRLNNLLPSGSSDPGERIRRGLKLQR